MRRTGALHKRENADGPVTCERVVGDGPTVVFVHGVSVGSSSRTVAAQISAFVKDTESNA